MIRGTRVMLLIDREQMFADDPELRSGETLAHAPMEFQIAATLRKFGCDLSIVAFRSLTRLQQQLAAFQPEVVFNLTEHIAGKRTGDAKIAAALDAAGVAYTGAPPLSLLLCRDKAVSKTIAAQAGVRVPRFTVARLGFPLPDSLPPLPALIKPVGRDSSEGIHMKSIARTPGQLQSRIDVVHRRYREPAIIEEFIDGIDISVGVVETPRMRILPEQQMDITVKGRGAPLLASYHTKHNDAYHERWGIRWRAAQLPRRTRQQLVRDVKIVFPLLALRDYARIDFRLDGQGRLYFIEANPNPGLQENSQGGTWSALKHSDLLRWILKRALARRRA
jgi:D-alanine-D-alanine ligase